MGVSVILEKLKMSKKALFLVIFGTIIWISVCYLFFLPEVRLLIIEFGQNNIAHRQLNQQIWHTRLINYALMGIGVYVIIVFLFLLEKIIISRSKNEDFDWTQLFFILITILAAFIRIAGFNQKTGDYYVQSGWVTHLRENGHFLGFKTVPSNYNAIYLYFCGVLSYLPESFELWTMKIISCAFDYICAIFFMKILQQMTKNKKIGLLTYAIILFSPTVFINSGLWAQCDSMYAAFLLGSLFYIIKGAQRKSLVYFGIALSFKLQAIFMLPLILFVFIYKKWSVSKLFYAIIGFISVSIPAWFLGWPLNKCIANYVAGTKLSGILTLNAPTIFSWGNIPGTIPVIFIATILILFGILIINKESDLSDNTMLLFFLFCNFSIPYFLPNMHERYFFVGELAVLLYSIKNPRRFWISFIVIIPALATYSGYLWETNIFSLQQLSIIMLVGVVFITKWLIESILFDQKYIQKNN